jgi:hypothetical protein
MEEVVYRYSNIVECAKSAQFPSFIKDLAHELNLQLEIDVEESGFIFKRQKIRFKIMSFNKQTVEKFMHVLHNAINDYQNRVTSISGCGTANGFGI